MSNPINIDSADHYVWCGNCDGWRLVRTAELSLIQERVPPGGCETRHAHVRARQFFFVDVVFLAISQPPAQGDRLLVEPADA
jgi:hypothetical protein